MSTGLNDMSKQKYHCEACGQVIENGKMITTKYGTHYHQACVTPDAMDDDDVITEV